jgi:hypothetical protein
VVVEDGLLPRHDVTEIKANGTNSIDKRFVVLEEGLINATLISYFDWRVCLLQHHHECLEVLFTDKELILLASDKIKQLHSSFVVDKDLLRRTSAWESKRRYTRAVFPAKDQMRRGKKDLVHAMRYLLFALQIFEHDRITDFTIANDLYKEIVIDTESTVADIDQFKKLMIQLEPKRHELSHLVGSARVSRRFYSRTDTEKRFLATIRASRRFEHSKRDKEPIIFDPSLTLSTSDGSPLHAIYTEMASAGTLEALEERHLITWLRDVKDPNILILNQARCAPDVTHPFMQSVVNGVVIRQPENAGNYWKILSLGLPSLKSTFGISAEERSQWNAVLSSTMSTTPYLLEEHIDGTLVNMYFDGGLWQLSTRVEAIRPEMPLSTVPINNVVSEISVNDAFWKIWKKRGYVLPCQDEESMESKICFSFIMNSEVHRYIVRYDEEDIFLVHARDMRTGEVMDHRSLAEARGWKLPDLIRASEPGSLERLESMAEDLNPLLHKGFILKTGTGVSPWKAVAVKSRIYVNIRCGTDFDNIGQLNMRAECDRKLLLDLAVFNLGPRFVEAFPQWTLIFSQVSTAYRAFCDHLDETYRLHWRKPRKEFAQATLDFKYVQALYRMHLNNFSSAAEMFSLMTSKQQQFYKPWKMFLRKYDEKLFNFFQGWDEGEE